MATSRTRSGELIDRRARRTQAALQGTLIELVEDGDLSRISVADVAERAGVSRSTFYDHYRDVHELAESACTAMIDDLIETMPSPGSPTTDPARQSTGLLLAFFAHLADHAGLYRTLLGPQGSARVIDHVRRRATVAAHVGARRSACGDHTPAPIGYSPGDASDYKMDIPHDVPAAFAAGALIGVATDWLQRGCPCAPAEMAALTWPLFAALYPSDAHTPARLKGSAQGPESV